MPCVLFETAQADIPGFQSIRLRARLAYDKLSEAYHELDYDHTEAKQREGVTQPELVRRFGARNLFLAAKDHVLRPLGNFDNPEGYVRDFRIALLALAEVEQRRPDLARRFGTRAIRRELFSILRSIDTITEGF